jgi:hypothetical protein
MRKLFLIWAAAATLLSCSKTPEDPATKELEINYQNIKGKWIFTTKINPNGSTTPCVFDCPSMPDFAKMSQNAYHEIDVVIANQNCDVYFNSNCDRYLFDGNRIINANNSEFFENARITSLTATTLKIEYDNVRTFGAGINQNSIGFIFTKQ